DLHAGEDAATVPRVAVHQVGEQGLLLADDVVAEQDRERLVADVLLGNADGVAQPERHLLPDVVHLGHLGDGPHLGELLVLALLGQDAFQLPGTVEVVLDRALAAAGDDQDVFEAGPYRLLDDVLDRRLVDHRQHLLGLVLGRRQEARPQPGGRYDRFTYFHPIPPHSFGPPTIPATTAATPHPSRYGHIGGSPIWT